MMTLKKGSWWERQPLSFSQTTVPSLTHSWCHAKISTLKPPLKDATHVRTHPVSGHQPLDPFTYKHYILVSCKRTPTAGPERVPLWEVQLYIWVEGVDCFRFEEFHAPLLLASINQQDWDSRLSESVWRRSVQLAPWSPIHWATLRKDAAPWWLARLCSVVCAHRRMSRINERITSHTWTNQGKRRR